MAHAQAHTLDLVAAQIAPVMTPELEACARRYLMELDAWDMFSSGWVEQGKRVEDAEAMLLIHLRRALADADARRAAEATLTDPREHA